MVKKRTYSKYGNSQRSTPYDPNWVNDHDNPKRAKVEASEEMRLPKAINEMKSSLLKKGSKFGGPTSLPNDPMDVEEETVVSKKTSVFDKVLNSGRHQLARKGQVESQSSRRDSPKRTPTQQKSNELRTYQLPTPPAEIQKLQAQQVAREPQTLSQVAQNTDMVMPKQPYVPKIYKAEETSAPRTTVLGDRLSRSSKESALWNTNQTNSPLLQLPEDIRTKIFEYVLGGKTIKIDYETYRTRRTQGQPKASVPIFKYDCTIYNRRTNPFKLQPSPLDTVTTRYSPLNNICRQLYEETATLPYKLNVIAFASASVMFNFLYQERRLSRKQRDAITHLVLPDGLLQQNMLNDLRGLQKFALGRTVRENAKGWYTILREEGHAPKLVLSSSMRW
ncbi:hypothetical protein IAQ61_009680 [Plenodomus lingam]|uniref:DUF7730 domain-containing protein n=1 Tax=Leptosphaeria maculans (strain JN3 / isolate v23.1.3 / race Av1-4-5-6-7-8) TaxID=985895 RepID=E4ZT47_LEPMJ|nr:hypothetical protein LEMA_P119690.1 [Plenodomus lingam JN3]KAH9863402.1 hypothetical protein IAQ61_009680 [Plenodomus lingam]CBX94478.1 hypothetical protein LEMA_P119690.1 [Plenodomus lingam JN3]